MGPAPPPAVKTVAKAARTTKKKAANENGDPQAAPAEKRARRYKAQPNIETRDRIYRALTQRLYLIQQEDVSGVTEGLRRKFTVLGSTGNVYEVTIGRLPSCNCPDCARGKLCKHIIFVMARVLGVPGHSPLIYQSALLQSELRQIFAAAPDRTPDLARNEVIAAYQHQHGVQVGGEGVEEETKEAKGVGAVNDRAPEGECPVCCESLTTAEKLDSCATCRNYIHKDCLTQWLTVQRNCVYCRTAWCSFGATPSGPTPPAQPQTQGAGARAGSEGYVNLAAQQGLSGRRDTSTYHLNRWGGYHGRYGDGDGDGDY